MEVDAQWHNIIYSVRHQLVFEGTSVISSFGKIGFGLETEDASTSQIQAVKKSDRKEWLEGGRSRSRLKYATSRSGQIFVRRDIINHSWF